MNETITLQVIQLIVGGLATVLAILLLPRTRNIAWILVILSVILNYGRILLRSLEFFGIIQLGGDSAQLIVVNAIVDNTSILFLTIALFLAIMQKKS